ncbi:MAG: ATP-binding cassette domain-containing protein [Thermoleophilia bacterium]|nr:ATP-binding cassette domain-containing protein [Thermoleophilia bacterium]
MILPMVVAAKSLNKRYRDVVAVAALDFEVEKGQCYGLVGPNGAGKTTTMKMVYCIVTPTSGSLRVFDMEVSLQPRKIKARLGVVPQENNLDPDLTVCQNLMTHASYFGLSRDVARSRCQELLGFVQLSERSDSRVPDISGGMKRRLVLARSLINNPDLLILDEPTTGLDPQVRHLIWDRLLELKDRGITLLLTTHYMEEAQKLCDRVLIMDQANAVDMGSPAGLVRKHVPPYVLELRVERRLIQKIQERFRHLGHQMSGQNVYFYGNSQDEFEEIVAAYPDTERIMRPASLEDVFLKLTGREIRQ